MPIETYSKKSDGAKQLAKNFKVSEFACPCCDVVKVDTELVKRLQQVRDKFGVPLNIKSGYRCEKQNAKTKYASVKSQHMLGKAVDCELKGISHTEKDKEIREYAKSVGLTYEKKVCHFHFDTRNPSPNPPPFNPGSETKAECKLNKGSDCCKFNPL